MQLTPSQIQEEQAFWLKQDQEHALFFMLGFEDLELRKEAEAIYNLYDQALKSGDIAMGLEVLRRSQALKQKALAAIDTAWRGWIFPSFIDHTRRELDAMSMRTAPGGLSSAGEICFWNRINSEHAAFVAHDLDPVEQGLHDLAMKTSRDIGLLADQSCAGAVQPTLLKLSKEAAVQLDAFVSDPKLLKARSVIHPLLAAHVQREGRRSIDELTKVQLGGVNPRAQEVRDAYAAWVNMAGAEGSETTTYEQVKPYYDAYVALYQQVYGKAPDGSPPP